MKISVSILGEIKNYKNAVEHLNKTTTDYLHLDVMDGTFTDYSSFSFEEAKNIKELSNKKLDVHIMSTNLDKKIDEYISLLPEIISIHVEVDDVKKYINKIKENNIKVGLAINPDTDISKIYPYLDLIDVVLVMSVTPGKSGQKFITNVISKLQELKELQEEFNYMIEVDGGINEETILYVKDYVDILVSGSFITSSDNYQCKIDLIEKIVFK